MEKVNEKKREAKEAWYVIHTYSGHENKVKNNLLKRVKTMNLEDEIKEILIPTEMVAEIKGGKSRVSAKRFYPGYILIRMKLTDTSWQVVRSTPGVFGFVGEKNRPIPLEEKEIENILQQMEVGVKKVRPALEFAEGETVRVLEGPFANFIGTVDEISPKKESLRVMINILGRNTPVELGITQVEKL
jgi:transcriptional antiterminator NusG